MARSAGATCYMCACPSETREHAPPLCLFPEGKDLGPGLDVRKNLITVPSCAEHNLKTSKDDEYLMVLADAHFENNSTARTQFATKVVRALKNSSAFVKTTFRNTKRVNLDGKHTIAFEVDDARFNRVLDKTVR